MANTKKNRVGEKYTTKQGCEIEIIEYFGLTNCTIRFNDGTIFKNIWFNIIKKGAIKNPMHPSVFNLGYTGIGEAKSRENKELFLEYITWHSMIRRCQDNRRPAYDKVTVCKEWCNYQNFAQWFYKHHKPYMQNWQLDKDILVKGNKIYSAETCCFVPREINMLFIKSDKSRGDLPIGVHFHSVKNKFGAQLSVSGKATHLGYFKTQEEAFQSYKTAKEAYIKEVADRWKSQLTSQTHQALINYKVEITD